MPERPPYQHVSGSRKAPDTASAMPVYAEPTRRALELTDLQDNLTDPMGSYTGQPEDPRDRPIQDADDL